MKINKLCANCGTPYEASRNTSMYCNSNCRQEAFQKRHQEEGNISLFSASTNPNNKKLKGYNKKQLAAEIALRKHQIDLEHKVKMAEIEERRREQFIKEAEIAAAKVKQQQEAKLKQEAEALAREWNPIKIEIHEILQEIIDKGENFKWKVVDLEDQAESLGKLLRKLSVYKIGRFDPFLDNVLYPALRELQRELQGALKDDNCYISETRIILTFKRSYIKELQRLQQQVINR